MSLNLRAHSTSCFLPLLLVAGCVLAAPAAQGQQQIAAPVSAPGGIQTDAMLLPVLSAEASFQPAPAPEAVSSSATEALPDAPSALALGGPVPALPFQNSGGGVHVAPRLTQAIPAGWTAQPLDPHEKVLLGLHDLYSPLTFLGELTSAGYSHITNGRPNFGTDRGAFGQRLGATALHDATESVFTDMVFAPMLHEDPRYYVQGPQRGFFYRVGYAASRPIVTRTDSGDSTINGAMLLGYAASSALTNTYYPQSNRNFHDTAASFGGSLAGSALGFLVNEFSDQVLQTLHLEKRQ